MAEEKKLVVITPCYQKGELIINTVRSFLVY